ncbi:hypothetical protein EYB25_003589 [Talaromyces marneffei]|nr:hypothetical protein EYB25_003589 [Talaromyces marneffei]
MLISQHAVHVQALRDLYKRCVRREGFPGLPLQESIQGCPGTHAILDRLGLIKHAEEAVENPQRVLEDLVNFIKCLDSASDCGLDSAESTTDSISDTTVSEELSPEPNTPRESPDLAVASTAGTWMTAVSDETYLCHTYREYKPMNPRDIDMALSGATDDAWAIRTDGYAEVPWNYCQSQGRYVPVGIDTTSYSRTEVLDIPPSAAASSSTWSEIAHHPSATFMPMTSRGSMSESLGYMTGQSGFPDGYFDAQAQTFATGLVQRQHLLKQQHQRQLRHSIDYGLLNSGGQYDYFYHSVMSSRALV